MDYPKFIVSNQKEESISIQRVNRNCDTWTSTANRDAPFVLFKIVIRPNVVKSWTLTILSATKYNHYIMYVHFICPYTKYWMSTKIIGCTWKLLQKVEKPGGLELEALATCCLPRCQGDLQQLNKLRIKDKRQERKVWTCSWAMTSKVTLNAKIFMNMVKNTLIHKILQ